jgi:hypothetical protein
MFLNLKKIVDFRYWEILVRQFECGSTNAPPSGCLQYFQGLTGQVIFKTKKISVENLIFRESTDVNIIPNNEAKVKIYGFPDENFCTIPEFLY